MSNKQRTSEENEGTTEEEEEEMSTGLETEVEDDLTWTAEDAWSPDGESDIKEDEDTDEEKKKKARAYTKQWRQDWILSDPTFLERQRANANKNRKKVAEMSEGQLKHQRKLKALADKRYRIRKEAREAGLPEEEVEQLVKQAAESFRYKSQEDRAQIRCAHRLKGQVAAKNPAPSPSTSRCRAQSTDNSYWLRTSTSTSRQAPLTNKYTSTLLPAPSTPSFPSTALNLPVYKDKMSNKQRTIKENEGTTEEEEEMSTKLGTKDEDDDPTWTAEDVWSPDGESDEKEEEDTDEAKKKKARAYTKQWRQDWILSDPTFLERERAKAYLSNKNRKKAAELTEGQLKHRRKKSALSDKRFRIRKEARKAGLPEEEVEQLVKQAAESFRYKSQEDRARIRCAHRLKGQLPAKNPAPSPSTSCCRAQSTDSSYWECTSTSRQAPSTAESTSTLLPAPSTPSFDSATLDLPAYEDKRRTQRTLTKEEKKKKQAASGRKWRAKKIKKDPDFLAKESARTRQYRKRAADLSIHQLAHQRRRKAMCDRRYRARKAAIEAGCSDWEVAQAVQRAERKTYRGGKGRTGTKEENRIRENGAIPSILKRAESPSEETNLPENQLINIMGKDPNPSKVLNGKTQNNSIINPSYEALESTDTQDDSEVENHVEKVPIIIEPVIDENESEGNETSCSPQRKWGKSKSLSLHNGDQNESGTLLGEEVTHHLPCTGLNESELTKDICLNYVESDDCVGDDRPPSRVNLPSETLLNPDEKSDTHTANICSIFHDTKPVLTKKVPTPMSCIQLKIGQPLSLKEEKNDGEWSGTEYRSADMRNSSASKEENKSVQSINMLPEELKGSERKMRCREDENSSTIWPFESGKSGKDRCQRNRKPVLDQVQKYTESVLYSQQGVECEENCACDDGDDMTDVSEDDIDKMSPKNKHGALNLDDLSEKTCIQPSSSEKPAENVITRTNKQVSTCCSKCYTVGVTEISTTCKAVMTLIIICDKCDVKKTAANNSSPSGKCRKYISQPGKNRGEDHLSISEISQPLKEGLEKSLKTQFLESRQEGVNGVAGLGIVYGDHSDIGDDLIQISGNDNDRSTFSENNASNSKPQSARIKRKLDEKDSASDVGLNPVKKRSKQVDASGGKMDFVKEKCRKCQKVSGVSPRMLESDCMVLSDLCLKCSQDEIRKSGHHSKIVQPQTDMIKEKIPPFNCGKLWKDMINKYGQICSYRKHLFYHIVTHQCEGAPNSTKCDHGLVIRSRSWGTYVQEKCPLCSFLSPQVTL